jgi:hypothetical protein
VGLFGNSQGECNAINLCKDNDTLNMRKSSRAHRRLKGLYKSPGGAKRIAAGCTRCWATIFVTASSTGPSPVI